MSCNNKTVKIVGNYLKFLKIINFYQTCVAKLLKLNCKQNRFCVVKQPLSLLSSFAYFGNETSEQKTRKAELNTKISGIKSAHIQFWARNSSHSLVRLRRYPTELGRCAELSFTRVVNHTNNFIILFINEYNNSFTIVTFLESIIKFSDKCLLKSLSGYISQLIRLILNLHNLRHLASFETFIKALNQLIHFRIY